MIEAKVYFLVFYVPITISKNNGFYIFSICFALLHHHIYKITIKSWSKFVFYFITHLHVLMSKLQNFVSKFLKGNFSGDLFFFEYKGMCQTMMNVFNCPITYALTNFFAYSCFTELCISRLKI